MDKELKKQIIFIILIVIMFILMFLNYHAETADYKNIYPKTINLPMSQRKPLKSEYLGLYTITAYCSCVKCCGKSNGITASGAKVREGRTVASSLPFGTEIHIDGIGSRVVEDRGVTGKNIDVFIQDHSEALKFGRRELRVFKTN